MKSYERKKDKKIDKKTLFVDDVPNLCDKNNYKLVQNSLSIPHTCSGAQDLHELQLFTKIKKFLSEKVKL